MNIDRLCQRYRKAPWEVLDLSLTDYAFAFRVLDAGQKQDEIDARKREREMKTKRRK